MKLEKLIQISVLISVQVKHIERWEVWKKSKNGPKCGLSSHKVSTKERYDIQGNQWGHSTNISSTTVRKLVLESKLSMDSTEDLRSGYPITSTIDEQVYVIHRMDDRHITAQQIAKSFGISSCLVHIVLTSWGWTNCLLDGSQKLTTEQKLKRVGISKTHLICFQENSKNFSCRLVTPDETCVYHFYNIYKHLKQISTGTICWQVDSFFFYSVGRIMIDYLEKRKKTINGQYYAWELRQDSNLVEMQREPVVSCALAQG